MNVMKFGGSSLADASCLERVADLVLRQTTPPCVVLSAMGDTTDRLFAIGRGLQEGSPEGARDALGQLIARTREAADELLEDPAATHAAIQQMQNDLDMLVRGAARWRGPAARATDAIVAHGERLATTLLAARLRERGAAVTAVDARHVVRTNDKFGGAKPNRREIRRLALQNIAPEPVRGRIVVTQGFVGATADGATTTLGRGGSDWSATLLGAAIGADEVQIWTDVEGVQTADPRVVPEATPIASLSAAEAAELAAFGAKILHPSTLQPAIDANIPVTVRHTMQPHGRHTRIEPHDAPGTGITALAARGPVTVLTMTSRRMLEASGYLAQLFAVFGEMNIPVDLIATAAVSVACTVEADAPVARIVAELHGLAHVEVTERCAIVAAIGDGLQRTPRVLERACKALHPIEPVMVSFGGNARNLSFVVSDAEQSPAVQRLHREFFGAGVPDGVAS
ncbi:MAG: aspartate kinase [Planctomycetota bacterium]